jgi:hypothetical protein
LVALPPRYAEQEADESLRMIPENTALLVLQKGQCEGCGAALCWEENLRCHAGCESWNLPA